MEIDKHSLEEAVRAKKAQKPRFPRYGGNGRNYAFYRGFFRRCGIDPQYVNPTPLGEGLTNVVFSYIAPDARRRLLRWRVRCAKDL